MDLKSLLSQMQSAGTNVISRFTSGKPTYTPNPQLQNSFAERMANTIASPALSLERANNTAKYQNMTKFQNFNFGNPMQSRSEAQAQTPGYASVAEKMKQIMGTDFGSLMAKTPSATAISAEDRINTAMGKVNPWVKGTGNFLADMTYRPLNRLATAGGLQLSESLGGVSSIDPNDPLAKLALGDQPVSSFSKQGKNNTEWFKSMGITDPKLATALGYGGMAIGSLLDASGVGSKGRLVKEGIEQALIHSSDDAVNALWKSKTAVEKLRALTNNGNDLIKRGFTNEQVKNISAKAGNWILENNLTPKAFADITKSEVDNKNLWGSFVPVFKEWVGNRQSAKFNGLVKSDEFKRLDVLGTQAFDLIQGAEHRTALTAVRNYFDDAYQRLAKSGVKIGYIQDYLPQMWKQSDGEVEMALGRRLSKTTPFSLTRIIKDYQEGIAANLTPKYNKLSDLVGAYETSIQKTLADRQFYTWLKDNHVIMTASDIAKVAKEKRGLFSDWVSISADRFGTTTTGNEIYKASPDIAKTIDNYLNDFGSNPSAKFGIVEKALKAGAGINTQIKNWLLSSGVPGTGANAFGYLTVKRAMLAAKNPVKAGLEATEMVFKPSIAQKYLDTNMAKLPDAVKHGLVMSIEDHDFFAPLEKQYRNILSKSYGVVATKLDDWFSKPLFSKILPAIKLKQYDEYLKIYLEQGLDSTQAKQLAAETTNNVFGGLNLDMLMKDKGWQVMLRNAFLAPDLYQSQINVGKGIVKTIFKKGGAEAEAYGVYMRNLLLSRLVSEIENKALSGHWQFQNDTGNKSNIETGLYTPDGHRFTIKQVGMDVSKIPMDLIDSVASGDISAFSRVVRNRLSPIAGMALGQATNTDYKGSPIYYPDATVPEQIGSRAIEASKLLLPSQVAEATKFATGQQSGTETALRLIEAPVYLQGGPKTKADEKSVKAMQDSGSMTGEDIYNKLEAGRSYNQPKKLTEAEQIANLKAGKPANTPTNWLGKPGKVPGVQDATTAPNQGTTGTGSLLTKYATEAKANTDKKAKVKLIYENVADDAGIARALQAEGITVKEAVTIMALDLATPQRAEYLSSIINTTTSRDEYLKTLANMMSEKLLTSAVITEWLDTDIIDDSTAKELRAMLKYISNPSSAVTGSGSKPKTVQQALDSMPASLKLKTPTASKSPAVKIPKVTLPTVAPMYVPKNRTISPLPSMADMKLAVAKSQTSGYKLPAIPQGFSR